MENLINTLKEQHWDILSSCTILEDFCKSGINADGGDIEKWINKRGGVILHTMHFKEILIEHLKEILIEHLKLEDKEFYPVLMKAKDKKIRETSAKFSNEMNLISKKVISFFETYTHLKVEEISQNEMFRLDLNTVITIIRRRIQLEDSELYPLYDKAIKK